MKFKLFYGWYIVIAGLIITTYYSAFFTYGYTAFIDPIMATFGWSLVNISLASSLRGVETGVFAPLFGIAADRWPARRLMLIGVASTAIGIYLLSRTNSLATYYIGFLVMGIASSLATSMIPQTTVARWFRKDIGKANGLLYVGMGIGGVLVPAIVALINKFGWQDTLMYSAIGFVALGVPASLVFYTWPKDRGLVPDGKVAENAVKDKTSSRDYSFGTSVSQALRMRAFWQLGIVTLFQTTVLGTVNLYVMPYLTNLGMARSTAGYVVSLLSLVTLCARLPVGILSDYMKKSLLIAGTLALTGLSLVIFWLADGDSPFWLLALFAVTYGVGIAGIMPLRMPIMVEYFGNKKIGTIFGLNSIFTKVGSILAPPLTGWVFDRYGSYKPFWLGLVVFAAVSVVLMLTMPPAPGRRESETN